MGCLEGASGERQEMADGCRRQLANGVLLCAS